ncbi:MAG TPA: ankyrin repeat domain-containing protein [Longimicrobiales bacterium]|nr:ankyrin repeat domain-containing protein [Longimicrobiales bacterium]
MSTTTEALEPELERSAPPEAPLRLDYATARTLLIVRIAAAVLALPFAAALALRSTGAFAVTALVLAAAAGWLFVSGQRRLARRPTSVTVSPEGLALSGRPAIPWAEIATVEHSLWRGQVHFGTRAQPRAASVDADLAGYMELVATAVRYLEASRRSEEPPRETARAHALFRRSPLQPRVALATALTGLVLGLVSGPIYFALVALALPWLVWQWLLVPSAVAVDDTAVWIIRPLGRDAIPLRAIAGVQIAATGRLRGIAVIIDHTVRGPVAIGGLGADALPLFDALVAARMRARLASRWGLEKKRSGSAIRSAHSRRQELRTAGVAALAFIAVAWITVLTGIPLRTAARDGHDGIARVALLLRSPVDRRGADGLGALHLAAAGNHAAIVQALIDRGADVDLRSDDGATPLYSAAAHGQADAARVLIAGGADVNARSTDGRTPLAHAGLADASGDSTVTGMLIAAGANAALADAAGRTPLHYAAERGHALVIRASGRAPGAVEVVDTAGRRALHVAVRALRQDAVAALIDAGADVDARDAEGRTALAAAAAAGAPAALVNLLLEAGASASIADDEGWNAVQLAVRENNIELLELFARSRAPLNATDGRVAPALWLATERGNTPAARALLRGGASPYVRWSGRRAIDVARSNRNATLLALMQMR